MSAPHGHTVKKPPLERVLAKKWTFIGVFFIVFALTFVTLQSVGAVPSSIAFSRHFDAFRMPVETPAEPVAEDEGELPTRIEIPSIGVAANITNPNTTNIEALDRALLGGAVRYPGTGKLGEEGNVLIFGHSSYLPVVQNQAYKAFNGIQNLKKGDRIVVYGDQSVYIYEVETVEESNTTTGEIALDVSGAKLTLATCDTFGAKSDRFIVTAELLIVDTLDDGV